MLGQKTNNIYLNIIGGVFHKRVPPSAEGAIERTTKDGKVVHEVLYSFARGLLENIELKDGNFGKEWLLSVTDGDENYVVQVMEESGYGDDLLTKIPLLEKNREYTFTPFDYLSKNGKKRSKFKIETDGEVLGSAYHRFTQNKDGSWLVETTDPSYPKPKSETMDSEDWKIYFMEVRKYLRKKAIDYLNGWTSFSKPELPEPEDDDLPF